MTKNNKSFPQLSQLEAELKREKYKIRYRKMIRSTVYALVVVAAVSVLVASLWMPVLKIFGTSMSPTLFDGDIVVSINSTNFQNGDMVAFYIENKILVKRCIANPGDWVDIDAAGNVSVNGERLEEPYLEEKALGECNIKLPYQVPEGKYFLMGDHRSVSVDSRNTAVGCIGKDQIVGKILFRIWPFNEKFLMK